MSITFRTTFSSRLRTGKRCKALNTRTKKTQTDNPVLVIDLNYVETLLRTKSSYKTSSLYQKDDSVLVERMFKWILSAFNLIQPVGILFIAPKSTQLSKLITQPIIYGDIRNVIFNLLQQQKVKEPLCILSNCIDLWALASTSVNMSFLAIDSNNRLLYYDSKTGLDIVSRFIGTYKIVNKLGLDALKYMNLQYLYILLFYIKFTEAKQDPNFYFDSTFFGKNFIKSKGLGLDLITSAHKFLSYAFLTKYEFLDYFLLGDPGHYSINLSRLRKLLPFDIRILETMKHIYDRQFITSEIKFSKFILQPSMPSEFIFSKPVTKKISEVSEKSADTSIESYITNLISGGSNGF